MIVLFWSYLNLPVPAAVYVYLGYQSLLCIFFVCLCLPWSWLYQWARNYILQPTVNYTQLHPASSLLILRAETKPDRSTSQDSSWTWHTWSFVKLCAVHLQQPRLVACGISLRSSGWLLVEYLYSQSVLISWTACKPCVPACLSLPDSTLYCLISNIPQTDEPRSTPQDSLNLTLSIKQFF